MGVSDWIDGDESAKEMLCRVMASRPMLLLPPPLHRVPLRVGNVLEVVGPSPSAKTHILMHAAIHSILPTHWNGVHYGGLGRPVLFIDLDCRFDVLRFYHLLKTRIFINSNVNDHDQLFALCMRRFLYVRCYDSLQFLATLKTLHYQLQRQREFQGTDAYALMIDSIGAFHWVDRASTSLHVGGNNRKAFSLQNVSETVVQEIKKLLLVHPMLVIATRAITLGDRYAQMRSGKSLSSLDAAASRNVKNKAEHLVYRKYLPSVWQSFVTHRILVRPADNNNSNIAAHHNQSTYLSEWLLPPLGLEDTFIVEDAGISCVS